MEVKDEYVWDSCVDRFVAYEDFRYILDLLFDDSASEFGIDHN